jgi:hypothetical protein
MPLFWVMFWDVTYWPLNNEHLSTTSILRVQGLQTFYMSSLYSIWCLLILLDKYLKFLSIINGIYLILIKIKIFVLFFLAELFRRHERGHHSSQGLRLFRKGQLSRALLHSSGSFSLYFIKFTLQVVLFKIFKYHKIVVEKGTQTKEVSVYYLMLWFTQER